MKVDITHGVGRVLRQAERYRKTNREFQTPEPFAVTSLGVLLALLDEDECRAAVFLSNHKIDCRAVAEAIPYENIASSLPKTAEKSKNAENENKFLQRIRFYLDGDEIAMRRFEPDLLSAVFLAVHRLHDFLPQVLLSTEHILYALSLVEGEVGDFLRSRNVAPEDLLENIARQEGIDPSGPEAVSIAWDDTPGDDAGGNDIVQNDTASQNDLPCLRDDLAAVYRILDASANRAIEAIRVLEDYVRFGRDDAELVTLTKDMRHELADALRELPPDMRLASRSTTTDVGTEIEGANEYRRVSLADVLGANFSRLQESLRSLEEYGKIAAPKLARTAERLRYRSYTLQKAVVIEPVSCSPNDVVEKRLADARLYVLVDCRDTEAEFSDLVQAVVRSGADVIQLRDKHVGDKLLLQRARRLRELTAGTRTLMIVNDRPDLALLSRADGVHVGQEELSVVDVRKLVGGKMLIGVSTHSIEQARQAVRDGADYIGVGPVFPSSTKIFDAFPGVAFLEQIAAEITLPAFAIGGIDLENLSRVIAAGVRCIAVQSVVTESQDPAATCRQLKVMLHHEM